MLPNLTLRQSWGIDSFERGLVLAALLLQQASHQCRLVPEDREIAIAANFPLLGQVEATATLTDIGVLSVDDPPALGVTAEPTPELLFSLPVEPDSVTTLEKYFVWCSQQLGLSFHPSDHHLLIQGRIPYDRSLWLVSRNLIRSVTTARFPICFVDGPTSDLVGAGTFKTIAPIPLEIQLVGSGRLQAKSIRASSADLWGTATADFEAGVWLEGECVGSGDLTVIPPVGATSTFAGRGYLTILDEPSFVSYGIGRASFEDGFTVVEIGGTGKLEAAAEPGFLWLPWIGRGILTVDASDPESELIGIGSFPSVIPGEVLTLLGEGDFDADPYSWGETELIGGGDVSVELDLTVVLFSGEGFFEGDPATLLQLFGSGYFVSDPASHLGTVIIGAGSCEGIQFGNQEVELIGIGFVNSFAALSSHAFLMGDGFFTAQPEEAPVCRVPCGSVTAGPLVFVNLDLGSVQEVT